jgi:endonuclease-3
MLKRLLFWWQVCYTKRMNTKEKKEALALLKTLYPDAKPALEYSTAYELLVAVVLSAQCTDARVNIVTRELFKKHNTPETMLTLTQTELERYIFSCGFYRNKAAHILSATKDIVERFGGEVPSTIEELMSLAGVGKKTANVVYSVWFGGAAIAVDTHVFRVSNRLGIAKGGTPEKVEAGLMKSVPKEDWSKAHHWMIYHGRQVCHSQKPDCGACALASLCDEYKKSILKK